MERNETRSVETIRAQYAAPATSKLDTLKKLDRKVKRPAQVVAYVLGTVGALVLGVGMCLAMNVIGGNMLPLGVFVGLVGIAIVSVNYAIYCAVLKNRKKKYAAQILGLSDELLEE